MIQPVHTFSLPVHFVVIGAHESRAITLPLKSGFSLLHHIKDAIASNVFDTAMFGLEKVAVGGENAELRQSPNPDGVYSLNVRKLPFVVNADQLTKPSHFYIFVEVLFRFVDRCHAKNVAVLCGSDANDLWTELHAFYGKPYTLTSFEVYNKTFEAYTEPGQCDPVRLGNVYRVKVSMESNEQEVQKLMLVKPPIRVLVEFYVRLPHRDLSVKKMAFTFPTATEKTVRMLKNWILERTRYKPDRVLLFNTDFDEFVDGEDDDILTDLMKIVVLLERNDFIDSYLSRNIVVWPSSVSSGSSTTFHELDLPDDLSRNSVKSSCEDEVNVDILHEGSVKQFKLLKKESGQTQSEKGDDTEVRIRRLHDNYQKFIKQMERQRISTSMNLSRRSTVQRKVDCNGDSQQKSTFYSPQKQISSTELEAKVAENQNLNALKPLSNSLPTNSLVTVEVTRRVRKSKNGSKSSSENEENTESDGSKANSLPLIVNASHGNGLENNATVEERSDGNFTQLAETPKSRRDFHNSPMPKDGFMSIIRTVPPEVNDSYGKRFNFLLNGSTYLTEYQEKKGNQPTDGDKQKKNASSTASSVLTSDFDASNGTRASTNSALAWTKPASFAHVTFDSDQNEAFSAVSTSPPNQLNSFGECHEEDEGIIQLSNHITGRTKPKAKKHAPVIDTVQDVISDAEFIQLTQAISCRPIKNAGEGQAARNLVGADQFADSDASIPFDASLSKEFEQSRNEHIEFGEFPEKDSNEVVNDEECVVEKQEELDDAWDNMAFNADTKVVDEAVLKEAESMENSSKAELSHEPGAKNEVDRRPLSEVQVEEEDESLEKVEYNDSQLALLANIVTDTKNWVVNEGLSRKEPVDVGEDESIYLKNLGVGSDCTEPSDTDCKCTLAVAERSHSPRPRKSAKNLTRAFEALTVRDVDGGAGKPQDEKSELDLENARHSTSMDQSARDESSNWDYSKLKVPWIALQVARENADNRSATLRPDLNNSTAARNRRNKQNKLVILKFKFAMKDELVDPVERVVKASVGSKLFTVLNNIYDVSRPFQSNYSVTAVKSGREVNPLSYRIRHNDWFEVDVVKAVNRFLKS